jgi:proline dehydrogenase
MKTEGKPVNEKREALTKKLRKQFGVKDAISIDFSNTEVAFADKSDRELKQMKWLFDMMNKAWLVNLSGKLAMFAIKYRLPFVERVIKATIFKQFCGGTTLLDSTSSIEKLYESGIGSILDYGVEGKENEEDFNNTMNENIRALEFAATHESAWLISTKVTGLARNKLLEKVSDQAELTASEQAEWESVRKRLDAICFNAGKLNVGVMIDAEETWLQPAIDDLAQTMMQRYNIKGKAIVYNTFQMYRKDRLEFLQQSYIHSQQMGYLLGAKLVRGAYMEKERRRAAEKGYPSPIHDTKADSDRSYNEGIRFCIEHHDTIALCNATHNEKSCMLMAQLIAQKELEKDHPHFLSAQLLGMSDNLSYNLVDYGFKVAKYMVYGSVKDVVPYLIRRAEENSSVEGDLSRERSLILKEVKRRGI